MQTRVGGGVARPTKNPVCNLVSAVSFQTRHGTFQTRLVGSLTGRGQKKRFPPFHTEMHCRRVGGGCHLPLHKFHLHLSVRGYIPNTTWYISNTRGGTVKKDLPSLFHDGGEAASDSGDDTGDIGIMDYGFEHRGHWDWDYDYGHRGHWDWTLSSGQIHGRVG